MTSVHAGDTAWLVVCEIVSMNASAVLKSAIRRVLASDLAPAVSRRHNSLVSVSASAAVSRPPAAEGGGGGGTADAAAGSGHRVRPSQPGYAQVTPVLVQLAPSMMNVISLLVYEFPYS